MNSHHALILGTNLVLGVIAVFIGYLWGRRGSHLEGSPFGVWLGGAMSSFIGGFVEAVPVGTTSGGVTAALSHNLHADLTVRHLALELAFLAAAPFGAGMAEVRTYIKTAPFPNVFLPGSPPAIAPAAPKPAVVPP